MYFLFVYISFIYCGLHVILVVTVNYSCEFSGRILFCPAAVKTLILYLSHNIALTSYLMKINSDYSEKKAKKMTSRWEKPSKTRNKN